MVYTGILRECVQDTYMHITEWRQSSDCVPKNRPHGHADASLRRSNQGAYLSGPYPAITHWLGPFYRARENHFWR